MRIFPNPAKDIIIIEKLRSDIEVTEIRLVNLEGRLIKSSNIIRRKNRIKFSLSNLTSGIYQFIFLTSEGQIAKKISVIE